MTNSSKRKGDRAELEVQALWRDNACSTARRALGAGRKDDVGDITGVPHTVVQVVNWRDVAAAVRAKPLEAERQRLQTGRDANSGTYEDGDETVTYFDSGEPPLPFACTFVRLKGGDYRVVMTPDQFFDLWREAIN